MQFRARLVRASLFFVAAAIGFGPACTAQVESTDGVANRPEEEADAAEGAGGRAGQGGSGFRAGGNGGRVDTAGSSGAGKGGGTAVDAGTKGGDGGADAAQGAKQDASVTDEVPAGWVPAIVGVGYAGVRMRSTNRGQSFDQVSRLAATGGDDENLLRAVAYGKGLWGAGGWKYLTSTDGVTWKQQQQHPCGGGIVDGLAYGNGVFIATCATNAYISSDGLTWRRGGKFESGGHPKVVFGGGKFAAFGDAKQVFESVDGAAWTRLTGMTDAASCMDQIKSRSSCGVVPNGAWGQGFWFRGYTGELGGEGTYRSADGKSYSRVSQTSSEAFAFGFAPP